MCSLVSCVAYSILHATYRLQKPAESIITSGEHQSAYIMIVYMNDVLYSFPA